MVRSLYVGFEMWFKASREKLCERSSTVCPAASPGHEGQTWTIQPLKLPTCRPTVLKKPARLDTGLGHELQIDVILLTANFQFIFSSSEDNGTNSWEGCIMATHAIMPS